MSLDDRIREASHPLEPLPTDVEPRIQQLECDAVLFDIYGTLVVSAAGEIGTGDGQDRAASFVAALQALDLAPDPAPPAVSVELFDAAIAAQHQRSRERGLPYPEIDVRDVWLDCLDQLVRQDALPPSVLEADCERLAVEFEVRVNPAWPMPGAPRCLEELRRRGITLGLISNAQFFTPLLFPALFSADSAALGFQPDLEVYSYRLRRAKPDPTLAQRALAGLEERGIAPERVLFVGNDRRNDVWPAVDVGFRAALFAGDARSYRPRTDEPDLDRVEPDVVVTDLLQLLECLPAP